MLKESAACRAAVILTPGVDPLGCTSVLQSWRLLLVDVNSLRHTEVGLVFTGRQTRGSPAAPWGLWVKWEELRRRSSPEPCGWRWAAWPWGPAAPSTSAGSGRSPEPWRWFLEELFQTLHTVWPPWRQNIQLLQSTLQLLSKYFLPPLSRSSTTRALSLFSLILFTMLTAEVKLFRTFRINCKVEFV